MLSVGGVHQESVPSRRYRRRPCTAVSRCSCSATWGSFRTWHQIQVPRLLVGVLLLALIPVAAMIPALAALALLTVMVVAIAAEAVRYMELREQVRHDDDPTAALHGREVGAG